MFGIRRTPEPEPKPEAMPDEIAELISKRKRIVGHETALPPPKTPERVIAERLDRQIERAKAKHAQQAQTE